MYAYVAISSWTGCIHQPRCYSWFLQNCELIWEEQGLFRVWGRGGSLGVNARKDEQDYSEVLSTPRSSSNKLAEICQPPSWAQRPSCAALSWHKHQQCWSQVMLFKGKLGAPSCLLSPLGAQQTSDMGRDVDLLWVCAENFHSFPLLPQFLFHSPTPALQNFSFACSGSSRTCNEHWTWQQTLQQWEEIPSLFVYILRVSPPSRCTECISAVSLEWSMDFNPVFTEWRQVPLLGGQLSCSKTCNLML